MRVEVDRDRCEGNAVCVGIAPPDLFELDEDDYAVVKADPVPEGGTRRWPSRPSPSAPPRRPDPPRLEVFVL